MGSSTVQEKGFIRERYRRERRELSSAEQATRASRLASLASRAPLDGAATVAAYIACDGELDPASLLERLAAAGTGLLLPRTGTGRSLELAEIGSDATRAPTGPAGIPEPTGPACNLREVAKPAILLVPSVALSRDGGRLGRGGGYFDRFLPRVRSAGWVVAGVCHARHIVDQLPLEGHDIRVDALLSEEGWQETTR